MYYTPLQIEEKYFFVLKNCRFFGMFSGIIFFLIIFFFLLEHTFFKKKRGKEKK